MDEVIEFLELRKHSGLMYLREMYRESHEIKCYFFEDGMFNRPAFDDYMTTIATMNNEISFIKNLERAINLLKKYYSI